MITAVSSDEGLAALLKRRRLQLGLSGTRVAELSGVKPTTIEAWEQGRVGKPPIHDVLKLARALAIPTAQIEDAVLADERGPHAARSDNTGLATEEGPLLERAMSLLGWSVSDAAAALQTSPQHIEAVDVGQPKVQQHDIGRIAADFLDGRAAVIAVSNVIGPAPQIFLKDPGHREGVFYQ